MRQRKIIPGVHPNLLIKDAASLMPDASRRGFLRGAASLGALTLLAGCDVLDSDQAEEVLRKVSKFNDAVQAWMFNPDALAPTFPESAITKPFPFNGYYDVEDAPEVDGKTWKLTLRDGLLFHDGEKVLAGNVIAGPAIIEETTTTVVIPDAFVCSVDRYKNYVLTRR